MPKESDQYNDLVFRICEHSFDDFGLLFAEDHERYDSLAKEAVEYGDAIVPALALSVSKGPFVHKALGYIGTPKAVEILIGELSEGNWQRVEAAASALELAGNLDALPALKSAKQNPLHKHVAEVHAALDYAINSLHRKAKGDKWLEIDEHNPFRQIKMVASQSFTLNETQRLAAIEWSREMIRILQDLQARDTTSRDSRKAIVWNLLATTTYYLKWPGDNAPWQHPCPEAEICWEHACKLDPKNSYFKERLERCRRRMLSVRNGGTSSDV